jgi:predicted RND superfamily exporter protein
MPKITGKPKERQIEAKIVRRRQQAPGRTVEARENQIARLAYDLAEEKIRKKTATSQEILYFLKMGSSQSQIEKLKLEHETRLLQAKTEALESQKKIEELYERAIRSMALYQGREEVSEEDDDD